MDKGGNLWFFLVAHVRPHNRKCETSLSLRKKFELLISLRVLCMGRSES